MTSPITLHIFGHNDVDHHVLVIILSMHDNQRSVPVFDNRIVVRDWLLVCVNFDSWPWNRSDCSHLLHAFNLREGVLDLLLIAVVTLEKLKELFLIVLEAVVFPVK